VPCDVEIVCPLCQEYLHHPVGPSTWLIPICSLKPIHDTFYRKSHATDVPIERCQTWNDSAGNQRHCTSENAKCSKSPSTSRKFPLIAAPSRLPPNCQILQMWRCITGDPLFWEPSTAWTMWKTHSWESGNSGHHSHKIRGTHGSKPLYGSIC